MGTLKLNRDGSQGSKFDEALYEKILTKEIEEWKKKRVSEIDMYEKLRLSLQRAFVTDK